MYPEDSYTILASADYGEGFTILLYKTSGGKYFACERTSWGKTERIMMLKPEQAMKTYEEFPVHLADYEEAFPYGVVQQG